MFSWAGYVADTTIPDFEAACGVTVEYLEYSSTDAMLTVVQTGSAQYDIVVSAGTVAIALVDQGLVQELDQSQLPTVNSVTPDPLFTTLLNPPFEYMTLYQGSTIGIAYDVNVVEEPFTSWASLFAYEGRVAWVDDARYMLGIAVNQLGYPLANPSNEQLQEAAE